MLTPYIHIFPNGLCDDVDDAMLMMAASHPYLHEINIKYIRPSFVYAPKSISCAFCSYIEEETYTAHLPEDTRVGNYYFGDADDVVVATYAIY